MEFVLSCSRLWYLWFEQSQAQIHACWGLGEEREPAQGSGPCLTGRGRPGAGGEQEHGLWGLARPGLTSVLATSWLS